MNRLFVPLVALMLFTGCQTMPSDPDGNGGNTSNRPPADSAERRTLGFVIEDLGPLDGDIELWLRNESVDLYDDGDWYPGYAQHVDAGWVEVTTDFLVRDGDPVSINGRYRPRGASKDRWLVEFIYAVPYSHIVLGSVQAADKPQTAEMVENDQTVNNVVVGVDVQFQFRE